MTISEATQLYINSKYADFDVFLKEEGIEVSTDFPNESLPENGGDLENVKVVTTGGTSYDKKKCDNESTSCSTN